MVLQVFRTHLPSSVLRGLMARTIALIFWSRLEDIEEHGAARTNFEDTRGIAAAVAIVGSREDRNDISVLAPIVACVYKKSKKTISLTSTKKWQRGN